MATIRIHLLQVDSVFADLRKDILWVSGKPRSKEESSYGSLGSKFGVTLEFPS